MAQVKANQRGKLSSVVCRKEFIYKPIIICDKSVISESDCIKRDNIVTVVIEDKRLEYWVPAIKKYTKKANLNLPPAIVLIPGNESISARGYGLLNSNVKGKEEVLAGYMVEDFMEAVCEIVDIVKSSGGKIMITPVIPRPTEQCYSRNSGTPVNIQELLSEVYVEVNIRIRKMNQDNRVQTPPIDTYLEKGRKYKNRKQKMIDTIRYQQDMITPDSKSQLKISTTVIKAAENYASRR